MAIKGRGMGIGDEKEIKRAFHEPVIIYLWPNKRWGRIFLCGEKRWENILGRGNYIQFINLLSTQPMLTEHFLCF